MEIVGAVLRPLPCLSGAGFDTHSLQSSFYGLSVEVGNRLSAELQLVGSRDSKISVKPRKCYGILTSGFSNDGYPQYYLSPRSDGKKGKEKAKISEKTAMKKKLKLIKGLSRDLSMFSRMGFGLDAEGGLLEEVRGKLMSEAAEVLLAQLQQLRAEEKEMKRKRKEEKAKLKSNKGKARGDCEASSNFSSVESTDSVCGEVLDISHLKEGALAKTVDELQQEGEAMLTDPSLLNYQMKMGEIKDCSVVNRRQECFKEVENKYSSGSNINRNDQSSLVVGTSAERIEVCMGGKCRKSGAAALLEEFQRRLGVKGTAVGCKCMGKCRDGPNVRVLNCCTADGVDGSVRRPSNPLCTGVSLEDVITIVEIFLGEDRKDFGLMEAP